MYRQIEFDIMHRVGEKEWKRIRAVKLDHSGDELIATDSDDICYAIDWENNYLLQSLQMFDKRGVPIYHGHILKDGAGKHFEVFYGLGSFFIIKDLDGDRILLTESLVMEMEVVGDIFNNSDLVMKPVDQAEFEEKIKNNIENNESQNNQN